MRLQLTGEIYDAIYDATETDSDVYQRTVTVKKNVTLVIDKETYFDYGWWDDDKEIIEKWLLGKEQAQLGIQGVVELTGNHIDVYKLDKMLS